MTKIYEMCGGKFETTHGKKVRFCSKACAGAALRKLNQEKREARARELGITVEELIKRTKRGRIGLRYSQPKRYGHRPKSYREIVAYNKAHPLVAGWRR